MIPMIPERYIVTGVDMETDITVTGYVTFVGLAYGKQVVQIDVIGIDNYPEEVCEEVYCYPETVKPVAVKVYDRYGRGARCPNCKILHQPSKTGVKEGLYDYCYACGQRLDWGETE